MSEQKFPQIECRLCRKKYDRKPFYHRDREIDEWQKICKECVKLWELGKKREKAQKGDGKLIPAAIKLVVEVDGRHGDPAGETSIKSGDLIAAMGATKLRGTQMGTRWGSEKPEIIVGVAGEGDYGSHEPVQVPKARAEAMAKILRAFHSALAKVRIDGFNDGRNLLAGLANGGIKLDDFSEQCDNARAGKKPRGRWG